MTQTKVLDVIKLKCPLGTGRRIDRLRELPSEGTPGEGSPQDEENRRGDAGSLLRTLSSTILRKERGAMKWLGPLDFSIDSGECVALVGRSGVGKTTLLRAIAGLHNAHGKDSLAKIFVNGTVVDDTDSRQYCQPWRRRLGFAFQNGGGLQGNRTVQENLEFPLRHGFGSTLRDDEIGSRIADARERFWLRKAEDNFKRSDAPPFLDQMVETLSGGQRQRVALARCFIRPDRSLFLLDEPLEGQDNPLRQRLVDELRTIIDLAKESKSKLGTGFLMVTHRQAEALALADRIIFLHTKDGSEVGILCEGRPEEIYYRPPYLTVAKFLGDPYMNIWPGRVRSGWLEVGNRRVVSVPDEVSNKLEDPVGSVQVGVRPEEFAVSPDEEAAPEGHVGFGGHIERLAFEGEEWILHIGLDIDLPDETGEMKQGKARIQIQRRPDWLDPISHEEAPRLWISWPKNRTHLYNRTGKEDRIGLE